MASLYGVYPDADSTVDRRLPLAESLRPSRLCSALLCSVPKATPSLPLLLCFQIALSGPDSNAIFLQILVVCTPTSLLNSVYLYLSPQMFTGGCYAMFLFIPIK